MLLKWLFDRTASLLGLVLLSPTLFIVALLIKIKMPGPVLFRQKRVGKGGKCFTMVKFRTMKLDHGGSTVSVCGESRITPLGAKLRKYKLDELPELWNVLKGEMSFVGPRPDVPGYADKLQGDNRKVLELRPGITGPASLKYRNEEEKIADFIKSIRNGDSVFECGNVRNVDLYSMSDEDIAEWYNDNVLYPDKVRVNLYYYKNRSFVEDMRIIIATLTGSHLSYNGEII